MSHLPSGPWFGVSIEMQLGARRSEEGANLADSRTAAFFAENLG